MPITSSAEFRCISQPEFHAIDREIMGLVFEAHNDLGCLHDERIYHNELAWRCTQAGFDVLTEVPIQVSHGSFSKFLYIDLLINCSVIIELKAVANLIGEHRSQTILYLLLSGIKHGKLINMGSTSVQHAFVSTQLTPEKRHNLVFDESRWQEIDADSRWFREMIIELLLDWGGFLRVGLLQEAIEHFRGGHDNATGRIAAQSGSRLLGLQNASLLNPEVSFRITALTIETEKYEEHLRRFLTATSLRAIQWVNLNHHNITFVTIHR